MLRKKSALGGAFLFIPALLVVILAGCDRFHGPTIQNGLKSEVTINIKYIDGSENIGVLAPCSATFTGKSERPNEQIQRVLIRKQGTIVAQFNKEDVERLLETERSFDGYSVRKVGPEGTDFVTGTDARNCQ